MAPVMDMTGQVYHAFTCHCCFTSVLNSVYFLIFFRYKQFANHPIMQLPLSPPLLLLLLLLLFTIKCSI
jgi:hypothetical protein